MTQIRNTKKQWVRKYCCRSVAAELLTTGKHVHSQIILILISFNLSQFVVWVLPRSVMPNRLSKILPYRSGCFWTLSYNSADLSLLGQWGSVTARRKCHFWETTTKLCSEIIKFAVQCLFCMAPIARSASKAQGGSSTQQNYMIEAFMSYWKSSTAWRNTCSLLHQ